MFPSGIALKTAKEEMMKETAVKIMVTVARPLGTAQVPSATARNRSHERSTKQSAP
jgi:hypothetical protein